MRKISVFVLFVVVAIVFLIAVSGCEVLTVGTLKIYETTLKATDTVVPTIASSPTPAATLTPTITSSPIPTATLTPTLEPTMTPDPRLMYPEFPTGEVPKYVTEKYMTLPFLPMPVPASADQFEYLTGNFDLSMQEDGFTGQHKHSDFKLVVKYLGYDETLKLNYLDVNGTKIAVRDGTLVDFISVDIDVSRVSSPQDLGPDSPHVTFDVVEKKFLRYFINVSTTLPNHLYQVYVNKKTGEIKELNMMQYFMNWSRKQYCEKSYVDHDSRQWKWEGSDIIHSAWFDGCPYVGVVE